MRRGRPVGVRLSCLRCTRCCVHAAPSYLRPQDTSRPSSNTLHPRRRAAPSRVALYGVDALVAAKKADLKGLLLGVMDDEKIRLREEVQEQIR